jgi:hypothetical protein
MNVQLSLPIIDDHVSKALPIKDAFADSLYNEAAHVFCDILQLIRRTPEGCTAFYRNPLPATSYSRRLSEAIVAALTKQFGGFIMQEGSNQGYIVHRPKGMTFVAIEKAFSR